MVDDTLYEEGEELRLVLGSPKSDSQFGASVGALNETLVKIKDTADSKPDEGGGEGCAANPRIKICDEIKRELIQFYYHGAILKGLRPVIQQYVNTMLSSPSLEPIIRFLETKYSVSEPKEAGAVETVRIPVVRLGDTSKVSVVRVHTKDGSAVSGEDYYPVSQGK